MNATTMRQVVKITLVDGEVIEMAGPEALSPAQVFVRVSANIVAGVETEDSFKFKSKDKNASRVRFYRNLGSAYDYVGLLLVREEKDQCVLFDLCVSQPEKTESFVQAALRIQNDELDFLQRRAKGTLSHESKTDARASPSCLTHNESAHNLYAASGPTPPAAYPPESATASSCGFSFCLTSTPYLVPRRQGNITPLSPV